MTFENHTKGEFHEQKRSENDAKAAEKEAKRAEKDLSSEDAQLSQTGRPGDAEKTIGLVGGQAVDDPRGTDISQYTGPGSKPSKAFKDPAAPYHQGPGSGLSREEGTEEADWENPEPENDSF